MRSAQQYPAQTVPDKGSNSGTHENMAISILGVGSLPNRVHHFGHFSLVNVTIGSKACWGEEVGCAELAEEEVVLA